MVERRIGTRERELAMGALDEHHRDGRLTTAEYTRRSTAASTARLRSELDVLFDDLPEPRPVFPGDVPVAPPVADDGRRDSPRDEELPELVLPTGAALARHAGALSAFAPIIAFALFAVTGFRFPWIFLLVPAALLVLGYLGHRHGR